MLAIVALSYTQTVHAYETSGGAYVVAKDNLGTLPSLVAAAALLADYILTVAVSVAAGVLAITSAAPSLRPYRVWLSLACIVAITRREPARRARVRDRCSRCRRTASSLSLYVVVGDRRRRSAPSDAARRRTCRIRSRSARGRVTLLVVLRAFASGSAALTGVESISNGVSAFSRRRRGTRRRRSRSWARSRSRSSSACRGSRCRCTRGRADGVGAVADRARDVPGRPPGRHVLRRPGPHARDPDPRGELVLPGLPAARGAARARPLLPAPVREPRRPARLLERDRRRRRARVAADRASRRTWTR